jgi:hypothetical protein
VAQVGRELPHQLQALASHTLAVAAVDWKAQALKGLAVLAVAVLEIMVLAQTAQMELPTLAVVVAVLAKELVGHQLTVVQAVLEL